MILLENTEAKARSIGALILKPGINRIDEKKWDDLTKSPAWSKPVAGLIEHGVIKVSDSRDKLTIAVVEKTYDPELLKEWAADRKNKGPLRGAILKQIEMLGLETVDASDIESI